MLGNAQVAGLFPVVYCSDGFCDLTGFSRAEVMQRGCACSFLYGPDTSELVRQQIRKALDEHKEFKAELILYRKSGEGATWPAGFTSSVSLSLAPIPSFVLPFHYHLFHLTISSHFPTSHLLFLHPTPLLGSLLFYPYPGLSLHSVSHLEFFTSAGKCPHVSKTDLWTHISDSHPCSRLPSSSCFIKPCSKWSDLLLLSQDSACISARDVIGASVSLGRLRMGAGLSLSLCPGLPFWCLLDVIPIKNEKGEVALFLVSHKDISDTKNRGGPEKWKETGGCW